MAETKKATGFTPEQMEIIQGMLSEARSNNTKDTSSISVYNSRDPKSIESVNVKRIEGKFVVGFKDLQNDSFKKIPKYLSYEAMPSRGLVKEPFITLILSDDGKEFEEKKMALVDYTDEREYYQAKCIEVKIKKIIEDHGILGSSGEYAGEVDAKGVPVTRQTVLAQTEREERVFVVELPSFAKPVEMISAFLA